MRKKFQHLLDYVYWAKESTKIALTIEEFESKKIHYEQKGQKAITKSKREEWLNEGTYSIVKRGYWYYLYCKEEGKYKVYISNSFNDDINIKQKSGEKRENVGHKAITKESKLFKELNGVTPRKAFGYCDRPVINKCVPKQFYHINKALINRNLNHVSKADFSSNYPSCMCGKLPKWQQHKNVKGRALPTEEYPFAFYIKSGHLAIYNELDTHDWLNHKLVFDLFGDKLICVSDDYEETILCKAAEYEYTSTIERLYEGKQRGEEYEGIPMKLILNSAQGYKHLANVNDPRYRLDHLAAVMIARSKQKMLNLYDRLFGRVLMIVVDGIIYQTDKAIGTSEKKLGELHQEVVDSTFRMRGTNQYIFIKDGVCVDECHGGFNANIKTDKLEDIDKWQKV